METDKFYNYSPEQTEQHFKTSIHSGLSNKEAKERLQKNGYNEFEKKKHKSLIAKFFDQFKSFMIIVLLVAAIISGVVGVLHGEGFSDAIIILIIVILNAVIGVFQEAKAEKSLDALEKMSSPQCKVIRDGQTQVIASRELVVGDIVILETGDSVPADIRLIEAINLKLQEAALTGESVPEEKITHKIEGEVSLGDRDNMAYASSSVTYGRGKGIVVATGMHSEVGKIASMIQSVPDTKTPMQQRLDKLGKILAIAALSICVIIFIVGVLYGRDILDMFMTAVSLAAAAIPEGLPAVSTIVLAVGVQRLAKRNAIVRKLPSVETLGSTSVICSDKTGTLTQNRMTVTKVYVNGEIQDLNNISKEEIDTDKELMTISILANDAKLSKKNGKWESIGDPTETALLDMGLKYNVVKDEIEKNLPRVAEIPFDSERKLMSTVHKKGEILTVAVKGGVDELLACCNRIYDRGKIREITTKDKKEIANANLQMAENALRVLAMATKEINSLPKEITPSTIETELVFVGMVGMIDPPREEVKAAVEKCRKAGIKPVMITGDHKITAVAIAKSLGIMDDNDKALTGIDVEKMSDEDLQANANQIAVYARVSPEHKVRIVKAFQANSNIVAMTGDGVNDAPALKLADIGVAMGITGTDVSKEAADVVLTDDNFATIVSAVEEGRRIYDNILKAIQFLLSTNIGEILVLFVAVMANWVSPLLPIHILWINLVTDSLPALALSVEPAEGDIMERKPIDSRKGIMTRPFTIRIFLQGILIALLTLTAYNIGVHSSVEVAQTMTFATLAFSQMVIIFGIRTGNHSAFKGIFKNKHLLGAIAIVFLLMLVVLFIPSLGEIFHVVKLTATQWWWVAGLSLAPLPVTEIAKLIRKIFSKKQNRK
ncbi:calcium-translocating P-type ATPase, PMCA-type [Paludibacter sp. 221]|uniref:calcium-translocating P-type ATPase, PMCA-type n=1 Tax=Paludibacter sp. 221 TaxID=2302939 RepID=UPI0013CFD743|nr:calcium-translocating P-type ATPase, PMCA-type [Paludibacter sp. 221]NDV46398.1 calcium-translocating P-type ATPase, PMCA-type [Paludibacter sp. 221]